jgi:hypothetical protein
MRANTYCIYGEPGTYKTSNIGRVARYVYEKTGKPTRLLSADGGGWEPIQAYIDAGIIQPLRLSDSPHLLNIMRKLWKGHWPNEKGDLVQSNLDLVGAYAIEGLTSIGTLVLRHLANKGQKISEDVVGQFKEGDESFAAPAKSHYGFTQNFVLDMIVGFSNLPVSKVVFSAHEGKGDDQFSKQLIYGPGVVGKAATDKIGPMVGDLFHFDTAFSGGIGKQEKAEVRAYFTRHPDSYTKVHWPAKYKLQKEHVKDLEAKWPDGYIPLTLDQGLDTYMEFQDSMLAKAGEEIKKFKQQVDAKFSQEKEKAA